MYTLESPNLPFAVHFKNTNKAMGNASKCPIFTQTVSVKTVTSLRENI